MAFLPLVAYGRIHEDGRMHPTLLDELVRERWNEMHRLASADRRISSHTVPSWRRRAGQVLAAIAVAVSVPASHRAQSREQVGAALCLE